jgi:hypothetical protein
MFGGTAMKNADDPIPVDAISISDARHSTVQ